MIVTEDSAFFLADSRYIEQADTEVRGYGISEIKGDLLRRGGERLRDHGAKKVLYDPTGLTVDELNRLECSFEGELVGDTAFLPKMRQVKSPDEIACIRTASELAEGVLANVVAQIEEGQTEREIAARIEYEFKKRGASGSSFDTIALFGPRAALPHGIPGEKALEKGDIVLIDMGCRHSGYCSDLTRTYAFGTIPDAQFEEIYALVLAAQLNALQAVRPGAKGRDVDAAARDVITQGGHGDHFRHSVGHGVGIEIHEAPRVSHDSNTELVPGMVITVEPGVYIPKVWGIRIEDLVVVTEGGCDILTTSSKELRILDA